MSKKEKKAKKDEAEVKASKKGAKADKKVSKKADTKGDKVAKGKKAAKDTKALARASKKADAKNVQANAESKSKALKAKAEKAAAKKGSKKTEKEERVYAPHPKAQKPKTRPELVKYEAPSDFTPFNFVVRFTTEADGHPGGKFNVYRYEGSVTPDKDPRKVHDMSTYDQTTLRAIAARMSMVLFHSTGAISSKGVNPRLEASTTYECMGRASKSKDGILGGRLSRVFKITEKKGKITRVELDPKDPRAAKIRRVNRHLPAAFVDAMALPKRERASRRAEADDE